MGPCGRKDLCSATHSPALTQPSARFDSAPCRTRRPTRTSGRFRSPTPALLAYLQPARLASPCLRRPASPSAGPLRPHNRHSTTDRQYFMRVAQIAPLGPDRLILGKSSRRMLRCGPKLVGMVAHDHGYQGVVGGALRLRLRLARCGSPAAGRPARGAAARQSASGAQLGRIAPASRARGQYIDQYGSNLPGLFRL